MEEENKIIEESAANPKPSYVDFDKKGREEFLSQIGNFSVEERHVFHYLCENWDHEIGYAKFITSVRKKANVEEKDLKSLMNKLKACGCGILLTRFVRGERGIDKIIMTEQNSRYFHYYFISNEYQKNHEVVARGFVNDEELHKNDINPEEVHTLNLNIDELSQKVIESEAHSLNIFKVFLSGDIHFYVNSISLVDLVKVSLKKIKYYFKSDNFVSMVAKLLDITISGLRTQLDGFDPVNWSPLTRKIMESKKLINSKFKNVDNSFYQAVEVIFNYVSNEVKEKDKQRAEEKKLRESLRDIVEKVKKYEYKPVSQELLNKMLTPYEEHLPEIKKVFYERYVDVKIKAGLPDVVFVGKNYIHKDNLYKIFLDRIPVISDEFREYFLSSMKKAIHSKIPDPTLFAGEPFKGSILTKLQDEYPVIYDLFKRKKILAEAIIHFSKSRNHSQNKMQYLLHQYFNEQLTVLKPIDQMLELDILKIYEEAHLGFPVFKRFLIVLFGKYKKYIYKYTGVSDDQSVHKKTASTSVPSASTTQTPQRSKRQSAEARHRERSSRQRSQGPSYERRTRPKPESPKYSRDEQDEAWSDLSSALKKK